VIQELNALLSVPDLHPLTSLEFSRLTADVIGPAILPAALQSAYLECCEKLFGPAIAVVAEDVPASVERLLSGWERLMRSVGRRAGLQQEKQVLDILSYEARAALDRCYSAVWYHLLLPHLGEKYQLSRGSEQFLRLWHLDQVSESDLGEQANFHLFHGHVFALHPAAALFLSTRAGRLLLGAGQLPPLPWPCLRPPSCSGPFPLDTGGTTAPRILAGSSVF
jgi:hypothetical protein